MRARESARGARVLSPSGLGVCMTSAQTREGPPTRCGAGAASGQTYDGDGHCCCWGWSERWRRGRAGAEEGGEKDCTWGAHLRPGVSRARNGRLAATLGLRAQIPRGTQCLHARLARAPFCTVPARTKRRNARFPRISFLLSRTLRRAYRNSTGSFALGRSRHLAPPCAFALPADHYASRLRRHSSASVGRRRRPEGGRTTEVELASA